MRTVLDEILMGELYYSQQEEELDVNDKSTYLPFMQEIVRLAKQELARWGNGTKRETDPEMTAVLKDYYRTGVNTTISDTNLRSSVWHKSNPWSAVFISWVLRKAGAGNYFRYSTAHWRYIADAKKKRKSEDWNAVYWAYRISERYPRIGDLVCFSNHGVNYDNVESGGHSHSDIVTDVYSDQILVIGGNTNPNSNPGTVGQKTLYLNNDGYIDTSRHPKHFAILSIY